MDESDVEEAEGRGESEGDATAVDGEEKSDSVVVEVMVRRRAGCLAAAEEEVVAEAMVMR